VAGGALPLARRPWPTLRELGLTLPLLAGARAELQYWNERWHGVDEVLRRLAGALRSARIGRRLDLDDGWQQARDMALALGRWASVDLSALVEEHAAGRVLVRVRVGLRLTWWTMVLTTAAFLAVVLALSHAITAASPEATAMSVALAVACLAIILWRTAGALAAVRRTVAHTVESQGAMALESGRPVLRFAPGIPPLLHAARGSLVTMLVAGPLLGSALLVNEARERVGRAPAGPPVVAPRLVAPAWREPRVGLAVAPNGDLYLADADADAIRRVTSSGTISTVVTSEVVPASRTRHPAPGSAVPLRFETPGGVAVSRRGDLFVADARGHRVYRVDRVTGATAVIAGTGLPGAEGDGGPAVHARLNAPTALAIARNGDVLVADSGNHRIRRIGVKTGLIETIAGGGDLPPDETGDGLDARWARLAWPSDLAVVPNGDLYIADTEHHRVRRVDGQTGVITTIAGTGSAGWSGDGGPALAATLSAPTGLAVVVRRAKTTVYIADSSNGRVRVVAPDGTISSLLFPPGIGLREPARLAYHPRGWLYVSDAADRITAVSVTGARIAAPAIALRPAGLSLQGM
jgi:sugar lactone lactonase YvrE